MEHGALVAPNPALESTSSKIGPYGMPTVPQKEEIMANSVDKATIWGLRCTAAAQGSADPGLIRG